MKPVAESVPTMVPTEWEDEETEDQLPTEKFLKIRSLQGESKPTSRSVLTDNCAVTGVSITATTCPSHFDIRQTEPWENVRSSINQKAKKRARRTKPMNEKLLREKF